MERSFTERSNWRPTDGMTPTEIPEHVMCADWRSLMGRPNLFVVQPWTSSLHLWLAGYGDVEISVSKLVSLGLLSFRCSLGFD